LTEYSLKSPEVEADLGGEIVERHG